MSVKIFLSHNSQYREIAKGLKLALLTLESDEHLDIQLSTDMAGARDWREWIEEKVRSADIFLLVFPHAAMEMAWCNYELGRFYDLKRPIVCLKNTDIEEPPPAFQPYQAYNADTRGILKFINELFVTGELTGGKVLNAEVGKPSSEFFSRARAVAEDIAGRYAAARLREHFYERRLIIEVAHDADQQIDLDRTLIDGNAEGLHVLGLHADAPTPWSTLKNRLGDNAAWLTELEAVLPAVPTGLLPPALTPFRAQTGVYIPVVVKAEVTDGVLTTVILIFVAANVQQLLPVLGWSYPKGMPDGLKALLQLVRMMFRARWEILAPRHQELRYGSVTPERCAQIAALVVADFEQMQRGAQTEGPVGTDQFYTTFHKALRGEIKACGARWAELINALRSTPAPSAPWLADTLAGLLENNGRWLSLAGQQFLHAVDDLA